MRRSSVIIIIIIVVLAAAGVIILMQNPPSPSTPSQTNNSQPATNSSNSNQPNVVTVNIKNMQFTPSQVTVAKGGTVTWTNNDSTTHTVIDDLSNVNGPQSGDIPPGQTYSFKFTKAGSYQYHCSIHPSMRGTIVVK